MSAHGLPPCGCLAQCSGIFRATIPSYRNIARRSALRSPVVRSSYTQPSMATDRMSGHALSGNVLEDVTTAASKRLALINFGQIAQVHGHRAWKT